MPTEKKLFSAVDALLQQVTQDDLPPPAERKRLRAAAGLTQTQIANALEVRREAVGNWEAGKTEPRSPQRAAYARLLENLAARFPAPDAESDPAPAVPETFPGTSAPPLEAEAPAAAPASEAAALTGAKNTDHRSTSNAAARAATSRPARTAGPSSTSRQPDARKATANAPAVGADPRFANGPLAVVDADADSQVLAYCLGGLILDGPAKSIPSLVDRTLKETKLGQPKLSGPGKDADPLLVLTEAACERYGLPVTLTDEERLTVRLPDLLPRQDGEPLPGGWLLGVCPGMVKHEGTRTVLWGEGLREQFNVPELNLARSLKTGEVTNNIDGK